MERVRVLNWLESPKDRAQNSGIPEVEGSFEIIQSNLLIYSWDDDKRPKRESDLPEVILRTNIRARSQSLMPNQSQGHGLGHEAQTPSLLGVHVSLGSAMPSGDWGIPPPCYVVKKLHYFYFRPTMLMF